MREEYLQKSKSGKAFLLFRFVFLFHSLWVNLHDIQEYLQADNQAPYI